MLHEQQYPLLHVRCYMKAGTVETTNVGVAVESQTRAERAVEALTAFCDLEYIIMGDLRQLLNEQPTPQTRPSMLVLLNRLLLTLPYAMRLSSEDCYMSIVRDKRPNWHRQIEAQHRDNLECYLALCGLRGRIEGEVSIGDISDEMDGKLREWMTLYARTRRRESQLLQEALTVDIGGEA